MLHRGWWRRLAHRWFESLRRRHGSDGVREPGVTIASAEIEAQVRARFGVACRISADRREGDALSITYDTPWLPRTWEEFVTYDGRMSAAIVEFIAGELGICPARQIVVRHAARSQRIVLLPSGTDGVAAVPEAPDYFRRTGQEGLFHRDRHTSVTFKL